MRIESIYAWIFISTAMVSTAKPAGLTEIISAADYIDHAIPTREELATSLGWLIARGLVEKTDKTYSLTPAGKDFYVKASAASAYVHKMRPRIEEDFAKLDAAYKVEKMTEDGFNLALELYYAES